MAKSKKPNLTDAIFHDEAKAREHLERVLWGDAGATCPRCGQYGDRITKLAGKSTRPGVYKCKDCRKPFSVTVGTVMERSHIPLTKWVMAAQFMADAKKGMSALQLQRHIGTNYETAWFLFHRLRECTPTAEKSGPLGGFGKVVEADTTFIGGKEKNKHLSKRKPGQHAGKGKMAVRTLVERGGRARSNHVTNVNSKTLRPIIVEQVHRTSTLMTDEASEYVHIGREFHMHGTTNHRDGEYVRGDVHSNTVEGYFALLKRGVYGQFHSLSEAHVHRYLKEFDWRYSNRHMTGEERAADLLAGARGKRLLYRQPDQTVH
jgi:transposase-like protein